VKLDPLNIGLIITTLVTVLAGWASQRSATRVSRANAKELAEVAAYERARAMDDRTIKRQDEEIEDLTTKNTQLRDRNEELAAEKLALEVTKQALVDHVADLQRKLREKDGRQGV
jgi:predicted RNase H-like nuclease (RuvC/YqgF family)